MGETFEQIFRARGTDQPEQRAIAPRMEAVAREHCIEPRGSLRNVAPCLGNPGLIVVGCSAKLDGGGMQGPIAQHEAQPIARFSWADHET